MNRPFAPARIGAAASLLVVLAGLAGCELLKRNEEATAVINARVLGKPAGEFFDRFGHASKRTRGRSTTPPGTTGSPSSRSRRPAPAAATNASAGCA